MTHDFILVPGQLASTAAQARAFFESQQGKPGGDDAEIIVAGLNGWNSVVTEAGKPALSLKIDVAGDTIRAAALDPDTAAAAATMMTQVADGLGYKVFDLTTDSEAGPAPERAQVEVTIGGERELSSVTEQDLHDWVPRLHQLAATPFLIVGRPNTNGMTYIQTYRNQPDNYTLEVQNGATDQHYSATLTDPAEVASLMWDWARSDFVRVNQVAWQPEAL